MTTIAQPNRDTDVVIVGAGVAGLAAAVALAQFGARVTLLERRPFVGGRAYSYSHPALDETIDSQHVILGCCTNFIDLIAKATTTQPTAPPIRWYDTLTFLEADSARQSRIHPAGLPAPFHNSLSFLRAPMLSLRDKAAIASGLARFLRDYPATDEESFATWLKRTHQTDRAIRHFWEPVVVATLNDTFANCSTRYAGKIFHESFLRSPEAGRLGIPAAPLSDFLSPVAAHACSLGVDLCLNSAVNAIPQLPGGRWRISTAACEIEATAVILATDLRHTQSLVKPLAEIDSCVAFDQITTAPITTIHLWYDREITSLDHAVLLDTRIQWVFNKSRIRRAAGPADAFERPIHAVPSHGWEATSPALPTYLELVISASHAELALSREQILSSALDELARFFPIARSATLLKSAVLKEARATFSVTPGLDSHRPPQVTPYSNLFVAGDWTATGWPSTMEGAIRSGRVAAGALTGSPTRFLSPELPATGLMRWLSR